MSRFFSNYQFISFGGCFLNFWWFEQSWSCFYFLVTVSLLSAVIVNKKKFGPNFSDATFLAALLQKRSDMFMLFLLGLRAIHINIIKIHNCPPKDIFNGAKLGVAAVARATPLFLPRPEFMYINMLHISAPPRTYIVCCK